MFAPSAKEGDLSAQERPRAYRFGWYGDSGLGEALIRKILSGQKTASLCPAYDPEEAEVGEIVRVVDKSGKARATIRIIGTETVRFGDIDEALAARIGSTLDDIRNITSFANSRAVGAEEEMRVTNFELVSVL